MLPGITRESLVRILVTGHPMTSRRSSLQIAFGYRRPINEVVEWYC